MLSDDFRGNRSYLVCLKLVSASFFQILIFSPNDSPLKTIKKVNAIFVQINACHYKFLYLVLYQTKRNGVIGEEQYQIKQPKISYIIPLQVLNCKKGRQ